VIALGLMYLGVAVTLLLIDTYLATDGLIAAGALVALAGGVALLLIGIGADLLVVLAVSSVVCAVSASGLAFVLGRAVLRRALMHRAVMHRAVVPPKELL
jgi:hypothetical protein